LSLPEQRQLEAIERSQRNELRQLERHQRRRSRAESRISPPQPQMRGLERTAPRRDTSAESRRALERKRLEIQMEQYRLPYAPRAPIR
jgi:hypothetical protein